MNKTVLLKEAIKTSLALVIVYYIGLRVAWMNPVWAGWAVAMISMPSAAGKALHKGLLRLAGTIPGCIAALVILSIAPQSRWLFIALAFVWIFFTVYMMLIDKRRSYFWNVAGFVALIILVVGPGSSENLFEHAVFRTLETGMGVCVYTMVALFIWPSSTLQVVNKSAADLAGSQAKFIALIQQFILTKDVKKELSEQHGQEVKLFSQFGENLNIEGSESHRVQEVRKYWDYFQKLSSSLLENTDRWLVTLNDIDKSHLSLAYPGLNGFFKEIDSRLNDVQGMMNGNTPKSKPEALVLEMNKEAIGELSHLDKAGIAMIGKQLKKIDAITEEMFGCVEYITDNSSQETRFKLLERVPKKVPTFDLDYIRGAAFAATTAAVGFIIWIFFNPVGHLSWFQFSGSVAMAIAGTQQLRITILVKPLAVASVLVLLLYVFVMPHLSTFIELGALLFLAMFVVCFFFKGVAQLAGMIAILNNIAIQNEQTYNFAGLANGLLFTILCFFFVFAMSYLLNSSRPEKSILYLMRRFFRSAAYLISTINLPDGKRNSFIGRLKIAFYKHELNSISGKINAWGRTIDKQLFPGTSTEDIQAMVNSLQALVYRIDELVEDSAGIHTIEPIKDLQTELYAWQNKLEVTFAEWVHLPDNKAYDGMRETVKDWVSKLEEKISIVAEQNKNKASEEEAEAFYRILGGYRGVTEASFAFLTTADQVDWEEWKEERFS